MSSLLYRKTNSLYAPVREFFRPPSRLELHYLLTPVDVSGNPIGKTRRRKAHSWVKQAAQAFNDTFLRAVGVENVKETDGTFTDLNNTSETAFLAAAGITTYGILVGTGVVAESKDDFAIGTLITEGVGAGQLSYSVTTAFQPPASITGGYRCRLSRQVSNSSGGTVTITEIGLVFSLANAAPFFLAIRDVLASSEAVLNNTGRIVEYQMDFLN